MKRTFFLASVFAALCYTGQVSAHCQLPCGIYHDDMVFIEIDQYVETMYKGISVMNENKVDTVVEKNQFIRWVMEKEDASNKIARRIMEYFLQQKVKPGEPDTDKKLQSIHKLLFLLVQIKQNASLQIVKQFNDEWEDFKLMFHSHDYECEMEKARLIKREPAQAAPAAKKADEDIKTMVPNPEPKK